MSLNIIHIKYHDPAMPKIENIEGKSDWYDLRTAEYIEMRAGQFRLISLGVSMQLPEGYEANIVPRSSLFKRYGIIMANSFAVIDNSFAGDEDIWLFPAYATRDTAIRKYERICQFRINKKQPSVYFQEVDKLNNENRGGIGSTGTL